jgi:UDP-GlcNAc:undecaprenyl-phosphate GlcNAc-1-phosphate transferase
MNTLLIFSVAFLASVVAVAGLMPVARKTGLVDRPSSRKKHTGSVPLVGGIAIFLAVVLVCALVGPPAGWQGLLAGAGLLLAIGIKDDLSRISPKVRLVFQAASILIVALWADATIDWLGYMGPGQVPFALGWMALPFTVFAGVGLVNAVNMTDGLDGLCGTLTLVALAALGIVAAVAGRVEELTLVIIVAGAVAGFLAYNFRFPGRSQALVFLGDAGSYLLGITLLYLLARLSAGPEPAMSPVTALWIMMVPLFDTVGMMLRRMKKGRSILAADREHIHHVFLLAKFKVSETVLIMGTLGAISAAIGIAGWYGAVPDALMLSLFLLLAAGYYRLIMRAWKLMRFLSRSICRRVGTTDRRVAERRVRHNPLVIRELGYDRRSGMDLRKLTDRRNASTGAGAPFGGHAPVGQHRVSIDGSDPDGVGTKVRAT